MSATPSTPAGPGGTGTRNRPRRLDPRHWGIRVRAALAGAVILLAALGAAGILAHAAVERAMFTTARDAAAQQAADVAAHLGEHEPPEVEHGDDDDSRESVRSGEAEGTMDAIEDRARLGEALRLSRARGTIVQVVAVDGTVRAAFPEYETGSLEGSAEGHDLVVARHPVVLDGETADVVVGVSTRVQADTLARLTTLLLVGVPVVGLVGTAAIWWSVGRALRPVSRMTEEVDSITAARLADRVAVPPTRDELAALAATMNRMLSRLETADRAQRQFFTDASHELRSPLAGLRTSLEVAAAGSAADPGRAGTPDPRYAGLLRQTERLGKLVEDLLTLGKAQEGGRSFQRVDTDLDDVVAGEVATARAWRDLGFEVRIAPARVTGDPGRLRQVVANLLSNAVRHAGSAVAVRLDTMDAMDSADGWRGTAGRGAAADTGTADPEITAAIAAMDADRGVAILTVDDDGAGIPSADRERVFERFVRLDESRARDSGGSGLGLHVSRAIARAHGGALMAGQAPDGRTRFTLLLPLG